MSGTHRVKLLKNSQLKSNKSHTLAYSLVALQEMNLAFKYPIIFWNCACLISDAGGRDDEDEVDEEAAEEAKVDETYYEEMEEFDDEEDEEDSSYDEDDSESGYPATIVTTKEGKKKKKVKATNYGKVAKAIGKMQSEGVVIAPPDVNTSTFTFSPDVENNSVKYGLSGITRIGADLIKSIIDNRPYKSLDDFLKRIKITKPQVINLIKAGAFDAFGDRYELMRGYAAAISDCKQRVTLQNLKMLFDYELLPSDYDFDKRVFFFTKYLKKMKEGDYYNLDDIAFGFYEQFYSLDDLTASATAESGFKIKQTTWDAIYEKTKNHLRPYIQANAAALLKKINDRQIAAVWNKYCLGSVSKWEMDSISCYIHQHELASAQLGRYEITDFNDWSEEPIVEHTFPTRDGRRIPIFRLTRIAGTVLDRDKAKKTISLLTPSGVVQVKAYGIFPAYDKQISERGADGKKHVIEKSAFARGNKIIVTGMRSGDMFLAKTYKSTPYHHIEIIDTINDDGTMNVRSRKTEEK